MAIQDTKLLPTSNVAEHLYPVALTTANSLTARPFMWFKPGYGFQLSRLGIGGLALTGAVSVTAKIVRGDGVLSNPNVRKDTAAEKFQNDAFSFSLLGITHSKALATAEVFSAGYVISINKWGVFTIQIDAAGTVSTLAAASTQAFATEAEALRSAPAAATNKVAIAHLTVQANVGATWTANTDDLTPASDCQHANFYQGPFLNTILTPFTTAAIAASGAYVEGVLATDDFQTYGSPDDTIVLTQTTDGTGALTQATVTLGLRPYPLNGQGGQYAE